MRGRKRCFAPRSQSSSCLKPPSMFPTKTRPGPGIRLNASTAMHAPVAPKPRPPYSLGIPAPAVPPTFPDLFENVKGKFPCPSRFCVSRHQLLRQTLARLQQTSFALRSTTDKLHLTPPFSYMRCPGIPNFVRNDLSELKGMRSSPLNRQTCLCLSRDRIDFTHSLVKHFLRAYLSLFAAVVQDEESCRAERFDMEAAFRLTCDGSALVYSICIYQQLNFESKDWMVNEHRKERTPGKKRQNLESLHAAFHEEKGGYSNTSTTQI